MVLTKAFPILERLLQNTKYVLNYVFHYLKILQGKRMCSLLDFQIILFHRLFHTSRTSKEYDGPGKTTVDIINKQDNVETHNRFLITKCLPV